MTAETSKEAAVPDQPSDPWGVPGNELGVLAHFIRDRAETGLDHHLASLMHETAGEHELWAGGCKPGHLLTEYPCDDYERSLSLGIAWLKDRIEKLEKPAWPPTPYTD